MRDDTGVTEMKKRSVVLLILLIGFGIITTSYAFTVTTIPVAVDFVSSPINPANRDITGYQAYPLGENSVYVTFTLGTGTLSNVEVRVMPLKSGNDVITSTGGTTIQENIDGGLTWDPSDSVISDGFEIVYSYIGTAASVEIAITFDEPGIALIFTTCMIEVREY